MPQPNRSHCRSALVAGAAALLVSACAGPESGVGAAAPPASVGAWPASAPTGPRRPRLDPPPVLRPVALAGVRFEVEWRAERATARLIGPDGSAPAEAVHRSLARSAIEAVTGCAVVAPGVTLGPGGAAEAGVDCRVSPLLRT